MQETKTRRLHKMLAALILGCILSTNALADSWPTKPIRFVIAFGPGSASDIFARLIAEPLQKALGQPVIVEARTGANGIIAAEYVAKSPPDGYTIFLASNTTIVANPYLYKTLPYNPMKDFTPIVRFGLTPFVLLVDAKLPIHSVEELVAYAKANPTRTNYAYTSSAGQIPAAGLNNAAGMGAVGVAYRSAPEAMTAVAGGLVTYTVLDFATSQPMVKSGRLRALAVSPPVRTALAPNLPTIGEAAGIPEFGVMGWQGLFAPANLPEPILRRLSTEFLKILNSREMQDKFVSLGVEPVSLGVEDFQRFVRSESNVWERQIKLAGVQPE